MRITKSLVLTFSIFAFVGCTEDGSKTYKPDQNRSTVKYTGEPLGTVGGATVSDSKQRGSRFLMLIKQARYIVP